MHELLERQLREYVGLGEPIPEELRRFIGAVSETYYQADDSRATLERALDAASRKLLLKNQELEQRAVREQIQAELVEAQGRALLEAVQSVALGDYDVEVAAPEGIEVLSELATGIELMVDDIREMLAEQARVRAEQQEARRLLAERVRALDCLNDIGRKIDEMPLIPDFLLWVSERLPAAMRHSEVSIVAIEFEGALYGTPEAVDVPWQIVQGLRVEGERAGRVYVAYREERDFADQESALLGDVARRVSGYVERRRLFEQTQSALAEVEAAHRRYLSETWDAFLAGRRGQLAGYVISPEGLAPAGDYWTSEMERALADGEPASLIERSGGEQEAARSALAVPLKSRGGLTIGVVDFVWEGSIQEWTDDERELIESLVAQTAESIVAEQLFEQTQLALAEARRLYEAGRRISAAGERQSILKVVLDVVATTAAHWAAVFMFDRVDASGGLGTQTLVSFWDRAGAEPPVPLGTRYTIRGDALSRVMAAQEPWIITDVQVQERLEDVAEEILVQIGAQAAALVPLSVGSECLGYVAVMTKGAHVFTPDELRVYQAVSNQAALGLQTLRLLRDAEHRARRERVIREISTKISDTVDLDSILNTTVQELGRALGVSRAFVRLTTGSETEMSKAADRDTDAVSTRATVIEEQSTSDRR